MRVLIVEDKRSMAEHLGRALEGEGYSVAFAYDGEEALRLGKTDDFDVMLLDVMLPRMDGFAVLRKMRESAFTPKSSLFRRATRCTTSSMGWTREPTII